MSGKLIVACAWHLRYFGTELVMSEKDGQGVSGTSHGLCPDCLTKLEEEQAAHRSNTFWADSANSPDGGNFGSW